MGCVKLFRVGTLCCVLVFLTCLEISNSSSENEKQTTASAENGCFCQLHGQIDDCTCNVDTVDNYNNLKIYPRLRSLLNKNYFRFFKVNLKRPCPFWSEYDKCSIRDCSVKPCTQEQLPEGFKASNHGHVNKYSKEAQDADDCAQERELSHLNTMISDENQEDFAKWKVHDDAQDNFCEMDDETSVDMEYVDLLLNPERYTGYKGESANRIWKSIYEENCFKLNGQPGYGHRYLDSQSIGELCLEKRVFYRAISGLHTSINIHLSANYLLDDKIGFGAIRTWGRNYQEFQKRFAPEFTHGEGPNWLKNLYFLYLLELSAIAKAAPYLENERFYTGNESEDLEVYVATKEILAITKTFPHHFNESSMFSGNKKQAKILKEEFRKHFLNISRIMDCVGCEKCRLWGKLQVQGLGTALKILFSEQIGSRFNLDEMKKSKFQLTRQEIVSLFNAFGRISNSIYELENFRKMD